MPSTTAPMAHRQARSGCLWAGSGLWRRIGFLAACIGLTVLIKVLVYDMDQIRRLLGSLMHINRLIDWIRDSGGVLLLFILCAIGAIISMDLVLNIVAGAAYGTFLGTAIYIAGVTVGCGVAFYGLKVCCARNKDPKGGLVVGTSTSVAAGGMLGSLIQRARALSVALRNDYVGLQITMLLRVSPVTPLSLCNALLALTELRFGPYMVGTFVGLIPSSVPYCYLGAIGKDLADKGLPHDVIDIVAYVIGGLATIAVSWKIYIVSERVLKSVAPDAADIEMVDTKGESQGVPRTASPVAIGRDPGALGTGGSVGSASKRKTVDDANKGN